MQSFLVNVRKCKIACIITIVLGAHLCACVVFVAAYGLQINTHHIPIAYHILTWVQSITSEYILPITGAILEVTAS